MIRIIPEHPHALALSFFLFPFLAQSGPVTAGTQRSDAIDKPAEVTLELTAHDKKGNPVLDLDRSEVQIIEGGKPVPLSSLRLVKEPQPAPFVTLVFDEVSTGDLKTHGDLANEFLGQASGKGLVMTVLRVEGRLHLMQPPTTDIDAVKKAVAVTTLANWKECRKASEAAEEQMEQDARSATGSRQIMAKILKAMLLDSQSTARDPRSTPPVAALLAASRGLQILQGRKYIIFFGHGLPYHSNTPEVFRDIAQAAARARVGIYALDAEIGDTEIANALITTSNVGTQQALGNFSGGSVTDPQGAGSVATEFTSRITSGERGPIPKSLQEICLRTGGSDVYALAGDSRSRARGIATDITSYYVASWNSPGEDGPGQALRVQLLRKGVALLPRFPARVAEREAASASERRLLEALSAPVPPADLPVNAAVLRFTPDRDIESVVVQAPIDHAAAVSVLAQLKDKSGLVVQRFSADIPQQAEPISFRRQFSAPPGEYVLESAVMDSADGKVGTRRDDVVIPPASHGAALGDVLLVGRIDAATADATDPLRCAQGVVVPNLSGRIAKAANAKFSLFFDLYTDPASSEAPSLSAELRRDGALIGTVPLKLTVDPKRPGVPYIVTLGTGSLHPGHYQTTVTLTQGGQKLSQSASFTLE